MKEFHDLTLREYLSVKFHDTFFISLCQEVDLFDGVFGVLVLGLCFQK